MKIEMKRRLRIEMNVCCTSSFVSSFERRMMIKHIVSDFWVVLNYYSKVVEVMLRVDLINYDSVPFVICKLFLPRFLSRIEASKFNFGA